MSSAQHPRVGRYERAAWSAGSPVNAGCSTVTGSAHAGSLSMDLYGPHRPPPVELPFPQRRVGANLRLAPDKEKTLPGRGPGGV